MGSVDKAVERCVQLFGERPYPRLLSAVIIMRYVP